jgi:hypothetical protein
MPKLTLLLTACAAGLVLSACQAQAPRQAEPVVAHQVVHAGAACSSVQPSLRVISDAASLTSVVGTGNRGVGAAPQIPAVDFNHQLVMQLSMGRQPTAGSRFQLVSVTQNPNARQLTVHTVWSPPEPGRLHATVVVQPCVVFSVPRGDYRSVRVLDQHGNEKLATAL